MKNQTAKEFFYWSAGVFMSLLTLAVVIGGIVGLVSWRMDAINYYGDTIDVQGTGEVQAIPDTALVNFTVKSEGKDIATSQESVSDDVNAITAGLEELGIDTEDISTQNYQSFPRYEWPDNRGERVLVGYELSQSVSVTVRDLEKAGDVLALLGNIGVNSLNGPHLHIDDTDELRIQAREEAIAKAQEEAKRLAKSLDARLGKRLDFSENSYGYEPMPYARVDDYGMGVAMMDAKKLVEFGTMDEVDLAYNEQAYPEPSVAIQVGEQTITSTVYMKFRIRK